MDSVITLNKKVGETPLQAIESYREKHGIKKEIPMAYAGRLDPMAEGKLLVLIGEACKRQKEYHGLDKAYEVEVLLGFSSDTHDVLGIATEDKHSADRKIETATISAVCKRHEGRVTLPYPAFSSKTVKGKPLFLYALEGTLDSIAVPPNHAYIYNISLIGMKQISSLELRTYVLHKIHTLPQVTDPSKAYGADFRRKEIDTKWQALLPKDNIRQYPCIRIRCICGSGTYMRSLAHELGRGLGTSGLALSIYRKKIGRYYSLGPWGIWYKQY